MSTYIQYIPQPLLSPFIESFWSYEADDPTYAKERRLPNGSIELIINLRADGLRVYNSQHEDQFQDLGRSVLSGVHSRFFVIDSIGRAALMGIAFKPGGAFPFLSMPACELHNVHVPLETLWGTAASDLRDQLLESKTVQARFHVLEQFLLARVAGSLTQQPAVAFALTEFQKSERVRTIAEVTER